VNTSLLARDVLKRRNFKSKINTIDALHMKEIQTIEITFEEAFGQGLI